MVHSAEVGSIPVADMSALIARLEAAEAGSAELDYMIYEAFSEWRNIGGGFAAHKVTGERRVNHFDVTATFTTSLDASLALAERMLPGWLWSVGTSDDGSAISVLDDLNASGGFAEARAHTPALAMCISILRAIHHGYEAAGEVSPNLKAKAQGEGG